MTTLTAEGAARLAARAAADKRAADVVVLDLQGLSSVADFFLVCSGLSTTQVDTIVDAVYQSLKTAGLRPRHREGTAQSGWVLLDYGHSVVHVFLADTRAFYGLERLWGDAPLVSVADSSPD